MRLTEARARWRRQAISSAEAAVQRGPALVRPWLLLASAYTAMQVGRGAAAGAHATCLTGRAGRGSRGYDGVTRRCGDGGCR